MKLPITEKFLLDLYSTIGKIDDALPSWPLSMREAICPDLKRLRKIYNKRHNRWLFEKLVNYLKRKGYIRIKELENKKAVILTSAGINKLQKISFKMKINKKRKDNKWQMVIFDIPEKKRSIRDQFRRELRNLGYQKFQRSIWVCPNNVLKETQNLIKNLSLTKCVRLLLVEEIGTS